MPRKRKSKSKAPPECKDGTLRRCLKCGGWICSTGSGNRLCERCFDDNSRISRRFQCGGSFAALPDSAVGEDF